MLIVCDTDAVDTAPAAGDADMFDISRLCSGACLLACLLVEYLVRVGNSSQLLCERMNPQEDTPHCTNQ